MTFRLSRYTVFAVSRAVRCLLFGAMLAVAFHTRTWCAQAETTNASGAVLISEPAPPATFTAVTAGGSKTYYLNADINVPLTSGTFISVSGSNVTIELNGHTISCTGGAGNTTNCIYAVDQSNITVRNGKITGFWMGIYLKGANYTDTSSSSLGHLIEDMSFVGCTYTAAQVSDYGSRIHRCRAILTGNSGVNGSTKSISFSLLGLYHTIEDCDVMGATGSVPSYGVVIGTGGGGTGCCFAVNNRISGTTYGLYFHDTTDKYRDNLTAGMTSAAAYCGDSGITLPTAGSTSKY